MLCFEGPGRDQRKVILVGRALYPRMPRWRDAMGRFVPKMGRYSVV